MSDIKRSRKSTGQVTLTDVAKLAGVSTITISRVLNTPEVVAEETRLAVQKAINQTGYVPNLLAGGLASTKSRLIAAVVPTISGPVFLETIQSLTESLASAGYQLMIGQTGYDQEREEDLISAIIGRRPDGIFLTGVMHSAESRKRLIASGIPVVEAWDLTDKPIDTVIGFSHKAVGSEVAEFLKKKGKNIGIITGTDERAQIRRDSFCKALGGKPLVINVSPPTTIEAGRDGLRQLLKADKKIDAIFCSSDMLALGVLIEAQVKGIKIPSELSVIGFADLGSSRDLEPALSSVHIDGMLIGRLAAEYFTTGSIASKDSAKIIDLGFSIISRAST